MNHDPVSAEALETLRCNGAVVLHRVLDTAAAPLLKAGVEEAYQSAGRRFTKVGAGGVA